MGHITHLRKQFKSINTYDYHYVGCEKKKNIIYFIRIEWFFIWQTWISFTQGSFVPILVEIGLAVLEKIFKFYQCIFAISLSPLKKRLGPSFEQIWILITQGGIVPTLVEIGPVFLEKNLKCILAFS